MLFNEDKDFAVKIKVEHLTCVSKSIFFRFSLYVFGFHRVGRFFFALLTETENGITDVNSI